MDHRKSIRRLAGFQSCYFGASPRLVGLSLLSLTLVLMAATPASAIPAFARREGQACGFCHSTFPKLNSTGMVYLSNGFRFPGETVQNAWDLKGGPPVAVIAEIEAFMDHTELAGQNEDFTDGPDIKIDEIEIIGAGNFSSRITGFVELEFDSLGTPEVGPTWAQVNDLVGETGEGNLNLRLGKRVLDLPFLSQHRGVIQNAYLAHEMLGFLGDETGAELNGNVTQGGSDDDPIIHRYGAGVARTDRNANNKFRKGFGYYAIELPDELHFGAIVTGGQDTGDPPSAGDFEGGDSWDLGVLLAGEKSVEADCGRFTVDLLYAFQTAHFRDLPGNSETRNFHNAALELLYSPVTALTFGTRVDWLIETEQPRQHDDGWRLTQLIRWNVIENAWIGAEYRHEEGGLDSPVTGNAKRTEKGRIFFALAL